MARLVMPLFVIVLGINLIMQMNKMGIDTFNLESLKRYYKNKVARLLVPIIILGVIEFVLLSVTFSFRNLLYPLTGLGAYFIPFLLVFFFLVAPILVWMYRKMDTLLVFVSFALFIMSSMIYAYGLDSKFFDYIFYAFYWAPVVVFGTLIGGYLIKSNGTFDIRYLVRQWWFDLMLLVGIVSYGAAYYLSYPVVSNNYWYAAVPDVVAIVPFVLLFLGFQYVNKRWKNDMSLFGFFGKYSLEIFLIQMIYFSMPIQGMLQKQLPAGVASLGVIYIVSLAIITTLAVIFAKLYHYYGVR
jgi:hypothetical protein